MDNNIEVLDIIDDQNKIKKKDKFMFGIYLSLVILIVLGLLIYFFGYELFKPFIKV